MGYYRNTIEDLYSGHFKNSYGVEGMCVTGRNDYKKIIDVSDDMKEHVLKEVKKSYYKYNGMSGGNEREDEAAWTLGQLNLELSGAVTAAIREKVPGWQAGEQIPEGMLDEIFSSKAIETILTRKPEEAKEAKEAKEPKEDRLTLEQPGGSEVPEEEKPSGKVAFNQEKRSRQLASAKTAAQVQVVLSLLKQDLADCENGLANDMCDENEVRKVRAMLQKAKERMSEVSGKGQEQEEESQGSFLINMLM